MFIIAGLGNPGDEYKKTRHNAGRIILENIYKKLDFSEWKNNMKIKALYADGKLGKVKVQFLMPDNFMNNSGKSVAPLIKFQKDLKNLIVIYDDIDLPIGKMRISFNRSSGVHNGLGSIIKVVKSEEFARIRIGISPEKRSKNSSAGSGQAKKPKGEAAILKFLLGEFKDSEIAELKKLSKKVTEALETMTNEGFPKAMSLYNN